MARPRRDGSTPAPPRKAKLSDRLVAGLKPQARPYLVWDTGQPRLVLLIQPSGHRAFKFIYSRQGRNRWYNIGDGITVDDARRLAAKVNSSAPTEWSRWNVSLELAVAPAGAWPAEPVDVAQSATRRMLARTLRVPVAYSLAIHAV